MKKQANNTAMLDQFLERLRAYINDNLPASPVIKEPEPSCPQASPDDKLQEKPNSPEPESATPHAEIRYSLAESAYDEDEIRDMSRFLSDARSDSAMYNAPALEKAYHTWEKQTAITKTFSSEVIRRLKESGIRPADFYKAAELDKRVYSSMKRDYCYTPSRTTAIKCCFALRLSYHDAEQLLQLAGYSLSPGLSKDLAIRFCLENGIYNITNVNYMLEALGETTLS